MREAEELLGPLRGNGAGWHAGDAGAPVAGGWLNRTVFLRKLAPMLLQPSSATMDHILDQVKRGGMTTPGTDDLFMLLPLP